MLEPFKAYSDFVRAYVRDIPGERAYRYTESLNLAHKTVAIFGLNSAILSARNRPGDPDGEVRDYGYLALTDSQLCDSKIPSLEADIKIVLMHHPLSWLVELDRVVAQDRLSNECHFVLHGHEHLPRVDVTNSTLGNHVVIPAGATYDRRIAINPRYTNAYNFVHLDLDNNKGTVYLRSWHEPRTGWREDTESAPNGRVEFPIPEKGRRRGASEALFARSARESTRRLILDLDAQRQRCLCDKTVIDVDINADGDSRRIVTYQGFRPLKGRSLSRIPGRVEVTAQVGHLERIAVKRLSGPNNLDLSIERREGGLRRYSVEIAFSRPLTSDEPPLTFESSCHGINTYAMSKRQFEEMYPRRGGEPTEGCLAMAANVPTAELSMIVKLPSGFEIPDNPALFVGQPDGQPEPDLQGAFDGNLQYNRQQNLLTLQIPYPPMNTVYRLQWPLPDASLRRTSEPAQRLRGAALQAARKNLRCSERNPENSPLNLISGEVLDITVEKFKMSRADRDSLEFSVMAYDQTNRVLRVVASSFPESDRRWEQELTVTESLGAFIKTITSAFRQLSLRPR